MGWALLFWDSDSPKEPDAALWKRRSTIARLYDAQEATRACRVEYVREGFGNLVSGAKEDRASESFCGSLQAVAL